MLTKRVLVVVLGFGLVTGCHAGWLNPSQPGFVIQTFTSYEPISGNNPGTITTNGNSYQFAGDNTGWVFIGGPGTQFRGKNDGSLYVDGDGSFVLGSFASPAAVTNRGKGSLLLGNLSAGQRALITDVGNACILLGAGTVSNSQAIVVGDGMESHGLRSVTAGSFWGMSGGFFGNGAGLTNLGECDTNALAALAAHSAASLGVHGAKIDRYVATNGAHVAPFTSWATASTNIQAAVDVASAGETVWVSNGVYETGSRAADLGTYRVVVTNAIAVRGVNGPNFTTIRGASSVCGVHLTDNAWLIGVTVVNSGSYTVWSGGVVGGSVSNCVLTGNEGNATGGAFSNRLYHCTLSYNTGLAGAGAVMYCTLFNCLLVGNVSDYAAAKLSTLYNCTLVNNTGDSGSVEGCTLYNCIFTGNENLCDGAIYYSLGGVWEQEGHWNIDGDPLFVDPDNGDYRLRPNSPCINTGTNLAWVVGATDLDGERRVYPAGGRVDMGAFESVSDAEAVHQGDDVVTAAQALGLGSVGQFMIQSGTQLVFVAGSVTNVIDADITH